MFFQYGSENSIYLLVELSAGTVPTWMTLALSLIVVIIRSAIYPEVLHLVNDFLDWVRSQCQQGRQKAHHASGHLIWPLLLTCERLHSSVLYFHQLHNSVLDPCVTFTKLLSMNEQLAGAGISTWSATNSLQRWLRSFMGVFFKLCQWISHCLRWRRDTLKYDYEQ